MFSLLHSSDPRSSFLPETVYNVWESNLDGTVTGGKVSPQGHGDIIFQLAQTKKQEEWDVPFITEDGKARRAGKDLIFKSDWTGW